MQYTTLGRTGLRVSVAGLGTGGFSRLGLRVNFIDTEPSYGTEGLIGKALKSIPRYQVVITTKTQIHKNDQWATPAQVVASIDTSLQALGTDYVDVFNLHGLEL